MAAGPVASRHRGRWRLLLVLALSSGCVRLGYDLPAECAIAACGPAGRCVAAEGGGAVCSCPAGEAPGPDLTCIAEVCVEVDCSWHGGCALGDSGAAECTCDPGYRQDGPLACVSSLGGPCTDVNDCGPFDPCVVATCNPEGCVYSNAASGSCDDLDACTGGDACAAGACAGTPIDGDGDGYGPGVACGGDCNDADRDVSPDGVEDTASGTCNDLLDNDCDGSIDAAEAGCAAIPVVRLVRDLNPSDGGSTYDWGIDLGGQWIFGLSTAGGQTRLYASDGTPAGTSPLASFADQAWLVLEPTERPMLGLGLFVGVTLDLDLELWRTDGSALGTYVLDRHDLLFDIGNAGIPQGREWGGEIYYFSGPLLAPMELRASDGTAGGDRSLGASLQYATMLEASATHVFYAGFTTGEGLELHATNGTVAGTGLVKDLDPGPPSGFFEGQAPLAAVTATGWLVFAGPDPDGGGAVWRSDGSSAGTTRVLELSGPGISGDVPAAFYRVATGDVVFLADTGSGQELFITDGSPLATSSLGVVGGPDATLERVVIAGGDTFLVVREAEGGTLWVTDGAASGTTALLALDAPPGAPSQETKLTVVGDRVYFRAYTAAAGYEPWAARAAGAAMLADLRPGPAGSLDDDPTGDARISPGFFADNVGSEALLVADAGVLGHEVYRTTGAGAPVLVADLRIGSRMTSAPHPLAVGATTALVVADDGVVGREPWVYHFPAPTPPDLLVNAITEVETSFYQTVAVQDGVAYFFADDGATGIELWRSDGSDVGTWPLVQGAPGNYGRPNGLGAGLNGAFVFAPVGQNAAGLFGLDAASTTPLLAPPAVVEGDLFRHGGAVYFASDAAPTSGIELWRTGGTVPSTEQVTELADGITNGVQRPVFASAGGTLYFTPGTSSPTGLWAFDGTPMTARQVSSVDTWRTPATGLLATSSYLYFIGEDGTGALQLWRAAIADDQVEQVTSAPEGLSEQAGLVALGDIVFFYVGQDVAELWSVNAALDQEQLAVSTASPSPFGFLLTPLVGVAATTFAAFYLPAVDGITLLATDGTLAGTRPLADLRLTVLQLMGTSLVALGDEVIFVHEDVATGLEPWRTDGSVAGTRLLDDVRPGPVGSMPSGFVTLAGAVLFFASDGVHGTEPWIYQP